MPETLLNKGKIKKSLFKRLFIMSTGNEKDAFPAQAPKLRQRKKPRTRIACRGSRLVRVTGLEHCSVVLQRQIFAFYICFHALQEITSPCILPPQIKKKKLY